MAPSMAHATPPEGDIAQPLDAGGAVRLAGFAGPSAPASSSSFAVSSFAFAFAAPARKGSGGRHGGARPHRAHAVTFRSCGWSRS